MIAHIEPTHDQPAQNHAPESPDPSLARKRRTTAESRRNIMNLTATREGRNLHLAFAGVDEPYVIPPLPARAGLQIAQTYLGGAGGIGTVEELSEAMMMAVDGAVRDAEMDRWHPRPEMERTNWNRIGEELSQTESEDVVQAAFFWQSHLGFDGVRIFLEAGGGIPGGLRALSAFRARMSILEQRNTNAGRPPGVATPTDRKQKKDKK